MSLYWRRPLNLDKHELNVCLIGFSFALFVFFLLHFNNRISFAKIREKQKTQKIDMRDAKRVTRTWQTHNCVNVTWESGEKKSFGTLEGEKEPWFAGNT